MTVKKDFSNSLLKRREIEVVLISDSNPGYEYVKKKIAQEFKVSEDVIVVRKLVNGFGNNEFVVSAFIYESVEQKDLIEPKKKEKKKVGGSG